MKHYNTVLSIAGSDSGGGAGIQADIKTISACGCYASTAITAVTVQNTLGVTGVHPVPVEFVEGQIDAVLSDIGADAIKIGMLQSGEIVRCIVRMLRKYGCRNVVVDPVMVSTSGHRLIEEGAMQSLRTELLPLAAVITPNIPEAEILLDGKVLDKQANLYDAAKQLGEKYGTSVLLKAGHLTEEKLIDIFYNNVDGSITELPSIRINTKNTHGTGCTMSSALASALSKGLSVVEAAKFAKNFINEAIIAGADYEIGHGHGPVNHVKTLSPNPAT
ncbi:MAG: bifunctional hydroxymethylpyrimidine kinase/phosphomethylpyrimidine kinase [Prevotellaceae bacterium]|nr:bifunctional hydroxymethylpyrimidine kinase/phosphomethylpyrimidine kinase [Candidatus Minthosoma equi]